MARRRCGRIAIGPLFDDRDATPPPPGLPRKIAALLSPTPIHVNDLARLLEAPAGAVAAALTELELNGQAASLPGGYAASSGAAFPLTEARLGVAARRASSRAPATPQAPSRAP